MDVSTILCLPEVHKIYIPSTATIHEIETRQIIRVQSISNYSKLFLTSGKTLVVAKVLRWFEEQLPQNHFIRVHRTHLVNVGYIDNFQLNKDGLKIELKSGERIDVSKRRRNNFFKVYGRENAIKAGIVGVAV